jgi:RNA polymerase sigma-70 factor (ECF subfamily)
VNEDAAVRFEPHRRVLVAHAYRMLGEHAEAEDIVQEAYLRWDEALARTAVDDDRAFLRATVTRLALDRLRSARARRRSLRRAVAARAAARRGAGRPRRRR